MDTSIDKIKKIMLNPPQVKTDWEMWELLKKKMKTDIDKK